MGRGAGNAVRIRRRELGFMGKYKDLTGTRFGRVVALNYCGREQNGAARWRVKCDCGCEFEASARNLITGRTRSCGCLRRDLLTGKPSRNKGGYRWHEKPRPN